MMRRLTIAVSLLLLSIAVAATQTTYSGAYSATVTTQTTTTGKAVCTTPSPTQLNCTLSPGLTQEAAMTLGPLSSGSPQSGGGGTAPVVTLLSPTPNVSSPMTNGVNVLRTQNGGAVAYSATCGGVACTGGNAITGWSITAQSCASCYSITSSGNLQGGSNAANVGTETDTVTVTAANSTGTSPGVTQTVVAYADGSLGAQSGTIQHPTILGSYTTRPPWNVPSVDYYVGIPSSVTLTDWLNLCTPSCPPGVFSVNSPAGEVNVDDNATLSGIDFTLHGGAYIVVTQSGKALTVSNSKFGNTPSATSYTIHAQQANTNITVTNSEFTGGNSNYGGFFGFQTTGTLTLKYNYFHQGFQHIVEQVSGVATVIYKYNLIENFCTNPGCHDNWLQWGTIGSGSTADVEFNTSYTNTLSAGVGPGEGFQFYANNSGTLSTTTLAFNTLIALPTGGNPTQSAIVHGGPASPGTDKSNYFDITGTSVGAYYPSSITTGTGWSCSGDINMSTGGSLTPC